MKEYVQFKNRHFLYGFILSLTIYYGVVWVLVHVVKSGFDVPECADLMYCLGVLAVPLGATTGPAIFGKTILRRDPLYVRIKVEQYAKLLGAEQRAIAERRKVQFAYARYVRACDGWHCRSGGETARIEFLAAEKEARLVLDGTNEKR